MSDSNKKLRELSHPTPWYVEVILSKGYPIYRVMDSLHNVITDFNTDKEYLQGIADKRNEDPDIKAENVQALWLARWNQYQSEDIEKHKRWRTEVEALEKTIRSLQDELSVIRK